MGTCITRTWRQASRNGRGRTRLPEKVFARGDCKQVLKKRIYRFLDLIYTVIVFVNMLACFGDIHNAHLSRLKTRRQAS